MSTLEKNLYKNLKLKTAKTSDAPLVDKSYKGLSTVSRVSKDFRLKNLELIKQDIINHFHIRLGEKLENPEFGTIIWDVLFEPMTSGLQNAILENVTEIINYDPRVQANDVVVDTYESGIQIYAELTYIDYNISEQLTLRFDQNNGLLN
jgi:phage baseplate assembly protein W